jgi:hypothetical protein
MKTRMISIALVVAILFGAIALPSTAAAQQGLSTPITGTVENGGTFAGDYQITEFGVQNEQLVAFGTLTGIIYDAGGQEIGSVNEAGIAMPVSGGNASAASLQLAQTCDILNLVLGPLDLNLLGLEVHLDTVVLDIVANPAGGLLGDLLCAVANLLDLGPLGDLLQIANLLNQILDLLS